MNDIGKTSLFIPRRLVNDKPSSVNGVNWHILHCLLQRRGHNVTFDTFTPSFGRGQMIVRLDNGVLVGGTESRTDSNIACY